MSFFAMFIILGSVFLFVKEIIPFLRCVYKFIELYVSREYEFVNICGDFILGTIIGRTIISLILFVWNT